MPCLHHLLNTIMLKIINFSATEADCERIEHLIASGVGNSKAEVIRRGIKALHYLSSDDIRVTIQRKGEEPIEFKLL